jgi:SAM-dependent methyltransferase
LEVSVDAIWHDVECGAYDADLALWEALAADHGDPVLDLGCGTGRVALHLARHGFRVWGVDSDLELTAELARRAQEASLPLTVVTADVRTLELEPAFPLALAPMQLLQMLGGEAERLKALDRITAQLLPGGVLAAAIVEDAPEDAVGDGLDPLPDVREVGGWIYSSQPLEIRVDAAAISVSRLRQTVSPDGELAERVSIDRLDLLDASALEAEAARVGLHSAGRRRIDTTEAHVGSTVVVLSRAEEG